MTIFFCVLAFIAINYCNCVETIFVQKNQTEDKEKFISFEFLSDEVGVGSYYPDVKFCRTSNDCGYDDNEICHEGLCKCIPYHERNELGRCELCPEEGETCTSCCFGPMLVCYQNTCVRCRVDPRTRQCV